MIDGWHQFWLEEFPQRIECVHVPGGKCFTETMSILNMSGNKKSEEPSV